MPRMMPRVPDKTLRHLEWSRVLGRLAEHCRGPVAADAAARLPFAADRRELDARLARTTEARRLLDAGRSVPLSGVPDVVPAARAGRRGGLLEPEQLIAVGHHLEAAARCRRYLADLEDEAPLLAELALGLADEPDLGRALLDAFDEHGELADSASGELGYLRTRVGTLHEQLKQRVHGLLGDPEYEGMLQDDYYTIREDRYVLPIRSGHKRHVEGIVHGWSASGQTVYIEPQPVVEANNKLLMAQAEVNREIRRVLTRLSRQVGEAARAIEGSQQALVAIDLAVAAGLLSKELEATPPALTHAPRLRLKAARHPLLLLAGVEVVPNDILIEPPHQVLVVTGPNTGGKTVALKTAGLCALMTLAGLHVPCAEGTTLPAFPGVFTDIGDEQSLDESTSTFSGHIANVNAILGAMTPGSLVLLDELAVGTDPLQGAALAQAVLEGFASRESLVVVTTHYESLKALPFDDARFRNGAMGFEVDRGAPTYHLTLDVPGSSSALRTARRLGLAADIVDRAEALAGPQQKALQTVIEALEREAAQARIEREGAEEERRVLRAARESAEEIEGKLRQRLRDGLARERDAALEAARKLRDQVQKAQRELKGQRRDATWLADQKSKAERAIDEVVAAKEAEKQAAAGPAPAPQTLKAGQRVWVVSLGAEAELIGPPDDRGRCEVRAGILTVKVDAADLRPVSAKQAKRNRDEIEGRRPPSAATAAVDWDNAPPQTPDNTCDLRGMRAHEALEKVERFLDAQFERDRSIAFIIHGHGTGALKREVRQWLRTSRYARDQRPGQRHEGGDGVTAVLLA